MLFTLSCLCKWFGQMLALSLKVLVSFWGMRLQLVNKAKLPELHLMM